MNVLKHGGGNLIIHVLRHCPGMIMWRSTMGTLSRPTCWGSTAATSPLHQSYRRGLRCTSSLCQTTPTRGRASRCATKSSKPVIGRYCCFFFFFTVCICHLFFLSLFSTVNIMCFCNMCVLIEAFHGFTAKIYAEPLAMLQRG